MGEQQPRSANRPEEGDDFYTMEMGRFKERTLEVVKLTPMILKHIVLNFYMAMSRLGKTKEEADKEFQKMLDETIARTDAARNKADRKFEERVRGRKAGQN